MYQAQVEWFYQNKINLEKFYVYKYLYNDWGYGRLFTKLIIKTKIKNNCKNKNNYTNIYSSDIVLDTIIDPNTRSFLSRISQTLSSILPGAWR